MVVDLQIFSISVFSPSSEWIEMEKKEKKQKRCRRQNSPYFRRKSLIMGIGVEDAEMRPRTDLWCPGSLYETLMYSGSVDKWMKREDKRMKHGNKNHPGQGDNQ